ncbi:hypothetical protein QBC47DRAFT_138420 [Echria macrotheca]|uniref:Uncharacterized protein n=1 Tax=Echria macrotheca TaxID=438768 RepID=A0AAJ0BHH4_9PEZI|nr:hypothetical protein QBC47DRAFT_138420 [Echria macrotheca]
MPRLQSTALLRFKIGYNPPLLKAPPFPWTPFQQQEQQEQQRKSAAASPVPLRLVNGDRPYVASWPETLSGKVREAGSHEVADHNVRRPHRINPIQSRWEKANWIRLARCFSNQPCSGKSDKPLGNCAFTTTKRASRRSLVAPAQLTSHRRPCPLSSNSTSWSSTLRLPSQSGPDASLQSVILTTFALSDRSYGASFCRSGRQSRVRCRELKPLLSRSLANAGGTPTKSRTASLRILPRCHI